MPVLSSFIHSIGMCRIRWFLAVLWSVFCSPLLCTFSCYPSPPTILPSSLTSSCHVFLGLPLNLVVPKFIYNTLLGILFFSILCTCVHVQTNISIKFWRKKKSKSVFSSDTAWFTLWRKITATELLLLQLVLQPLVGFGLLYDFVPQYFIFTLLSPVSHFHLL